jgi:hypothetical protein
MPIKDMLKSNEDPFRNVALQGPEDLSDWKRIPGLFRKWEFAQIVEDDDAISFQKQGKAEDGTQLWAMYRHCPEATL